MVFTLELIRLTMHLLSTLSEHQNHQGELKIPVFRPYLPLEILNQLVCID